MKGMVKRALLLKDIPLDKAFRGTSVSRVIRVESKNDSDLETQESGSEDNKICYSL